MTYRAYQPIEPKAQLNAAMLRGCLVRYTASTGRAATVMLMHADQLGIGKGAELDGVDVRVGDIVPRNTVYLGEGESA